MRHHDILGVAPTATIEEIQKAYRKKAMACHPDRNPGDEDAPKRFMEAQDAYDALTKEDCKPPRHTSTPNSTPTTRRRSADDWIKDAPQPTHDIWGNPMGPERPRPYKPAPPRRPVPVQKYEPEVDLWRMMEAKTEIYTKNYWKEYDRLKISMAYEEPDKFWEALDEWMRKNK